jgi:hypothetical protein
MSHPNITIAVPTDTTLPLITITYDRDVVQNEDEYHIIVHDNGYHNSLTRTPQQIGHLLAMAARSCGEVLAVENGNGNLEEQMTAEIVATFNNEVIQEGYEKQ